MCNVQARDCDDGLCGSCCDGCSRHDSAATTSSDSGEDDDFEESDEESGDDCRECGRWAPRSGFSKTQWAKGKGRGRCKVCVDGAAASMCFHSMHL